MPKDRPGIVFVKVPRIWGGAKTEDEFAEYLRQTALAFFRETKRIVSVKFHTSLLVDTGSTWSPLVLLLEITNPNHRFDQSMNWNVFSEFKEIPSPWITLLKEC